MPKFTVKIQSPNAPPLVVSRKCETIRDVVKLLRATDHALTSAARIWPQITDAKVTSVSVTKE